MKFFQKLERKFGHYAIQNLMLYLTVLYAIGFAIALARPLIYYEYLALDVPMILKGQVWRLVTFLIYPPSSSWLWGLLMLLMYYSLGSALERAWGSFRFNVFMFMGILFHIICAFVLYFCFNLKGSGWILTPDNLNLSIFMAFAVMFPESRFYLYFIIPVKAKYFVILYIIMGVYTFIFGDPATKITLFLSMLNFIIFFAVTRDLSRFRPSEMKRKREFFKQVSPDTTSNAGRMETASKIKNPATPRHRCAVCGKTELDDPNLEFRFCSKCNGNYEYCSEHLFTHKHVE